MPIDFIFMLTQNDKTVANARACVKEVIAGGARHIGFKDIGIPVEELSALTNDLRKEEVTIYMEVVSLDEASERKSAQIAMELGVDYLLGGTRPEIIAPLVKHHPIKYYPFVGKIEGHPSVLVGTIEDIVQQTSSLTNMEGVDGIDLLAYRFQGNVPLLIEKVKQVAQKDIIIAGSIDRKERIEVVKNAGVRGFTVGTAAFENLFEAEGEGIGKQVVAIMKIIGGGL